MANNILVDFCFKFQSDGVSKTVSLDLSTQTWFVNGSITILPPTNVTVSEIASVANLACSSGATISSSSYSTSTHTLTITFAAAPGASGSTNIVYGQLVLN